MIRSLSHEAQSVFVGLDGTFIIGVVLILVAFAMLRRGVR